MICSRSLGRVGILALLAAAAMTSTASATVGVSRAELNGSQLRLEGTATASRTITANGVAVGSSDSSGRIKIQYAGFAKPADCRASINDGSAAATNATLSGCTPSATSPPPPLPPPPPATPTPPPPAPPTPTPPPPSAPAPALSTVRVSPTDVLGGTPVTGTVTLASAAPSGGVVVPLTSDDPTAATVPASVTVPAGATSATFPVTTNVVPNPRSSLIIGTAGGVTTYAILTVWTPAQFSVGTVSILPGNGGSGTITSSPAGIDCIITRGSGSGTCTKQFPIGTVVQLSARAASGSSFQGWRQGLPGCSNASRITVARGTNIVCQPSFVLR